MVKINYTEIKPVKVEADEQEISIIKSRKEDFIEIYCSDNSYLNKIIKKIQECPEGWECYEAHHDKTGPTGYIFKAPKRCLSIRTSKDRGRLITEEERKIIGKRLHKKLD